MPTQRHRENDFVVAVVASWFIWQGAMGAAWAWTTLPSRKQDNPSFAYTPSPADWRAKPIYQIITDRFANGDTGNDNARGGFDSYNGHAVHGGDFKGIQSKLDYLKSLGIGVIWISPVTFAVDRDGNGNMPYHGYAPFDLNQIESHFGSLQDLRNLVDAAHARGIYVIIDILVNNFGDLLSSRNGNNAQYNAAGNWDMWWHRNYTYPAPFDTLGRFHNNGAINNYDDINQYIRGDLTGGLDDLITEDAGVRIDLLAIYKALVAATDCDGFRIDAVKHVETGFWDFFLPDLRSYAGTLGKTNFLMFGEVFSDNDSFVASFTGPTRFQSMQYFPMQSTMAGVFNTGAPTSQLTDRLNALAGYDAEARGQMVSFLGNQDLSRTLTNKVALTFLYTATGIPCLYYGTEQGFNGGSDPYNREDMFDGNFEFGPSNGDNFNTGHELFRYVQKLNDCRVAFPALVTGPFTQRWQNASGRGIFAFTKSDALVVLNTSSDTQTCYPGIPRPTGTIYINALDPSETLTNSGGSSLPVTMGGQSAKIFVPVDQLNLRWVGHTYNWPASPLASQDVWINSSSWPQGAGTAAFCAWSTNGMAWTTNAMPYGGLDVTNDWWHVNLGKFPGGTTVRYSVGVTDRVTGTNCWDDAYQTTIAAGPMLTWIGNVSNFPATGQMWPTDDLWVNIQGYPQGAATAGQVVFSTDNATWFATNMTFDLPVGLNDSWHANLGKFAAGKTIRYAVNMLDSRGTSLWANNGGANYAASVNTPPALGWIGNVSNFPADGQITTGTDVWINIDSYPRHSAVSARVVFSSNGGATWYSTDMSLAGVNGNNDWWHANLGKFASRTTIRYAIEVRDAAGASRWANNSGANYSITAN